MHSPPQPAATPTPTPQYSLTARTEKISLMFLLNTVMTYSIFVEEFVTQITPRYYEDDFQIF